MRCGCCNLELEYGQGWLDTAKRPLPREETRTVWRYDAVLTCGGVYCQAKRHHIPQAPDDV